MPALTPRWTPLKYHPVQHAAWLSKARFIICPAARRSGKTEIVAKRKCIKEALTFSAFPDGRFIFSAPTHAQAKLIYWNDLKLMVPKWAIEGKIRESELSIPLFNGAVLSVIGMDKPERVEGAPVDRIILDEYGNMKKETWDEHVRPALSTPGRPGTAAFIGVPEGRNHYFDLWQNFALNPDKPDWDGFTWKTAEINPEEAAAAREDMDILTYRQEYEGEFITFEGRAYYAFDRLKHSAGRVHYQRGNNNPIIVCFDFNKKPGVASIAQEITVPDWARDDVPADIETITGVFEEVYIETDSTTQKVATRVLEKIGHLPSKVHLYGDATGGSQGSAKLQGSDWDIINAVMKPELGSRLKKMVPRGNPNERDRVNSMNSRLENVEGHIKLLVDPKRCRFLVKDLEGVSTLTDGSIDKPKGTPLTHISDALGYYIVKKFPVRGKNVARRSEM